MVSPIINPPTDQFQDGLALLQEQHRPDGVAGASRAVVQGLEVFLKGKSMGFFYIKLWMVNVNITISWKKSYQTWIIMNTKRLFKTMGKWLISKQWGKWLMVFMDISLK